MAYGILKVDTITFTDAGVDKSVTISGLVQNPTFSGNITVTGTVSGNTIQGQTVSGATITGGAAQFTNITGGGIGATTITGTTVTGTTANFVSGVFTTQISGATVTGTTANFTSGNFTALSGASTTVTSGIFAVGSAAAPSISFASDPNTGIYSPGADQVAISTNGTGRLFVDANGSVGLGTSQNPTAGGFPRPVLFLKQFTDPISGFGGVHIEASGNQSVLGIGYDGTAQVFAFDTSFRGTGARRPIIFKTTGAECMRIDASGNVGVGTSSPSTKLEVRDGTITAGNLSDVLIGRYSAGFPSAATGYFKISTINDTDSSGGIAISTLLSNTFNERFRIDRDGRVGIGTSAPSALLHIVSGDAAQIIENSAATSNASLQLKYPSRTWSITNRGADLSGSLTFRDITAGADRVVIDSSGRVGIGTTSPAYSLDIAGAQGNINLTSTTGTNNALLRVNNTGGTGYIGLDSSAGGLGGAYSFNIWHSGSYPIVFANNNTERLRIDSSGRLLVGTSTAVGSFNYAGGSRTPQIQLSGSSVDAGSLAVIRTATGPVFFFGAGTSGTDVAVNNGLGYLSCHGYHTNGYYEGARISAEVDGTPGANDMPGRLIFSTTADGASSPTQRMVITNNGNVGFTSNQSDIGNIGASTNSASIGAAGWGMFQRSAETPLFVNRNADDGALVQFYQAAINEGSISVSGTTVSYNGAHLSRWTQLPSGAERTEILRGSVLSNLDEMCEWDKEDNEQLNRMKVSDVEGDKNVSGVFQAWDDDDDTYTNDFYCAMTGDFIIRISEGVTVERGDLLMSAGDGTAKPQDDDIIRSKTIAKVTSTYASCTYEDGSYCVPCVLMAC